MDFRITDNVDLNNNNNIINDDINEEETKNIEKELLLDNKVELESKIRKRRIIISVIITVAVILIIFLVLFFVLKKPKNKMKDEKIRLKNWEFASSKTINLSPEELSKGKKSDLFNKAPEDFYVCTPMGGLSGHSNKYYYETELQKIDKTQFDDDWYFRSHFELKDPDVKEGLVLLHINGINYKSDIYIDGNLVSTKDKIIGTFIKYSLDITKYLDKYSKIHYVVFKISRPYNHYGGKDHQYENDLAISFVDWNPPAPDSNMGIWQPVDVEIFEKKTINNFFRFYSY